MMSLQEKRESKLFHIVELTKKEKCNSINEQEIKENIIRIQQTFFRFGIRGEISNISVGARFTRYEIMPKMEMVLEYVRSRKVNSQDSANIKRGRKTSCYCATQRSLTDVFTGLI